MTHYLHSLCRVNIGDGIGWYAPIELTDSQKYVAYAIPVDDKGVSFALYKAQICKVNQNQDREITWSEHSLEKYGNQKRFTLILNGMEINFKERKVFPTYRKLRYLGRLKHNDFTLPFIELEPEKPYLIDTLFEHDSIVIMGCNPFEHYQGLENITERD